MNILQIVPYDFFTQFRCNMIHDSIPGDTIIQLESTESLKINDALIIGVINGSTTELAIIKEIINNNSVKLDHSLRYVHDFESPNTVVTKSLFDRFNIYYGNTADISTHKPLMTQSYYGGGVVMGNAGQNPCSIPMSVTRSVTTYVDSDNTHGPEMFYSFTYFNSCNFIESNRMPIISSGINTDITPQFIKETYLYGLDLTEDDGQPLPDTVYWEGIKAAYAWLEQTLNIDILPRTYVEEASDFRREEYLQWIFLRTSHFPVTEVTDVKGTYYGNDITFPLDWVRIKDRAGMINLVPGGTAFSQFIIPSAGGILPILNNQMNFIPSFWKISYKTGFKNGELPYNIKDFICKRACFMPLNILGDLTGGVAVSSKSIGVDGLSQGVVYTGSAENHGYSARLRMYTAEMKAELPSLIHYWRPVSFGMLG